MSRTPKPMRQIQRRVMRALARQGPTPFCLPPPPQDEAGRERLAVEDEMLMRIVPPVVARAVQTLGRARRITPEELAAHAQVTMDRFEPTLRALAEGQVPEAEAWLWQDPTAMKSVQQGLKDSAKGKLVVRGSP